MRGEVLTGGRTSGRNCVRIPRGEAWLVDTNLVIVGQHKHRHDLGVGVANNRELKDGQLVTFESNGARLDGPLDFSGVKRIEWSISTR